ncbi:stage VI sporulation protein D [Oceanobacillus arenosus]|uniref:Stage VI sporulation protein D n=1 Tax=Oceanobacillus arenosus TaxID=1229153 RepID=A0A3D8PVE5_9BACI|nr:LysM peptidoglycan-binding domain-containing protein [Oceanobacillus arenosus]RDW19321.1 stage VI sporulation protein D [Oceanobacillus arenosus]
MTTDSSVFTFELNESLFFEKGQEVAELRGIALDPEISIQAYTEYISIKGVIELRGEYVRVVPEDDEQTDSLIDFVDLHAKRYIEKVINVDDDIAEFTHHFPIEISVPTYRVTDLNDVSVSIEAFDYEIPEESQLKLYSTIAIHGIDREVNHPQLKEEKLKQERLEREELKQERLELEELKQEEVRLEARKQVEQEQEELELEVEVEFEPAAREEDTFEFEIKEKQELDVTDEADHFDQEQVPIISDTEEVEENEAGRVKIKSQSFAEFFNKIVDEVQEEVVDDDDLDDDDWFEVEVEEETYVDSDREVIQEVKKEVKKEVEKEEDREVEDVSYLSDVFRNSEEDKFIKMRLCIVQKEDTIDTIAERFHVSAIQLIKQNQLDDDFDVSEGQLLYIPAEKK